MKYDENKMKYSRYLKEKKQVSHDNGETWIDLKDPNGNYIVRQGELYESNLDECSEDEEEIYRFVDVDPFYHWEYVETPNGEYDVYSVKKKQITYDGVNYFDVLDENLNYVFERDKLIYHSTHNNMNSWIDLECNQYAIKHGLTLMPDCGEYADLNYEIKINDEAVHCGDNRDYWEKVVDKTVHYIDENGEEHVYSTLPYAVVYEHRTNIESITSTVPIMVPDCGETVTIQKGGTQFKGDETYRIPKTVKNFNVQSMFTVPEIIYEETDDKMYCNFIIPRGTISTGEYARRITLPKNVNIRTELANLSFNQTKEIIYYGTREEFLNLQINGSGQLFWTSLAHDTMVYCTDGMLPYHKIRTQREYECTDDCTLVTILITQRSDNGGGWKTLYKEIENEDAHSVYCKCLPKPNEIWYEGYYTEPYNSYAIGNIISNTRTEAEYESYIITTENPITTIGSNAFKNKTTISSITLSRSVEEIGSSAFYGCLRLATVILPDNIKKIGNSAFYNCMDLHDIELPNSITEISDYAFFSASTLNSIKIPSGMTRINYYTFKNCKKLTSVTIPTSITEIKNEAFYDCIKLTDIFYNGTSTQFKAITKDVRCFGGGSSLPQRIVHCTDGDFNLNQL